MRAGNFATVAIQCLEKLDVNRGAKVAFNCDHHTFNYLVDGGYSTSPRLSLPWCHARQEAGCWDTLHIMSTACACHVLMCT